MLRGTVFSVAAVVGLSLTVSAIPAQVNRGYTGVTSARVSGGASPRTAASGASISGLQSGLAAFRADMGRMPTGPEGLMALIQRPVGATNWRGPYISTNNWKTPFADPWGTQYRYFAVPAGANRFVYTIASNGPDRVANTRDDLSVQF